MKKVAYLGIPGSYSYIAAKKYFMNNVALSGHDSFREIVQAVKNDNSDFGLLPLENSLTGSIYEVYDLIQNSGLKITGEIVIKIKHCLIINSRVSGNFEKAIKRINKCYSHPQAFKQCQNFFSKNKQVKPVFTSDTGSSVQQLSKAIDMKACAIGSKYAAQIYKLTILSQEIADNKNNLTRFIILNKKNIEKGNKISVIFSVRHIPGSLVKALEPYSKWGLNLTKIESRPVRGKPWEYIFFVDLELGKNKSILPKLIKEMREKVNSLQVLGQYKKGKIYES